MIIPLRDGYRAHRHGRHCAPALQSAEQLHRPRSAQTDTHPSASSSLTPVPGAAGLVQGQPALQTCLVRGAGLKEAFGVTRVQLTPLSDRLAQGRVVGLERARGPEAQPELRLHPDQSAGAEGNTALRTRVEGRSASGGARAPIPGLRDALTTPAPTCRPPAVSPLPAIAASTFATMPQRSTQMPAPEPKWVSVDRC